MQSMEVKAIFAYLHYISFIGVFVTLFVELVLFKKSLSVENAKKIQKADSLYGLFAMLVLATGLIRVFYLEKGGDYYFSNYLFVAKLSLFILVGLLSIYPTVYFIKWRKQIKEGLEIIVSDGDYNKVKKFIYLEIGIIIFLPLLAALMARGFGF